MSEGMDLRAALKKCILEDMIGECTNHGSGYCVLVTDSHTLNIISSVCTMQEITQAGVLLVQNVNVTRQPMPDDNGLYFLSPRPKSMNHFLQDFTGKTPQFKSVHLFVAGMLEQNTGPNETKWIQKIKENSVLVARLKHLTQLKASDFHAVESRVFSCQREVMETVFYCDDDDQEGTLSDEINTMARQIVAACCTTNQNPRIRYLAQGNGAKINQKLAEEVRREFDRLNKTKKGDGKQEEEERGQLVIGDRSFDCLSPLTHEYTYQAQIQDLLPMEGELLNLSKSDEKKDIYVLNESDATYVETRHGHMGDASQDIYSEIKTLAASPAAQYIMAQQQGKETDMKQLTKVASDIAAFKKKQNTLLKHKSILDTLSKASKKLKMDDLAEYEQDVITGVSEDGQKCNVKSLKQQFPKMMRNPELSPVDKLRLYLIFMQIISELREDTKSSVLDDGTTVHQDLWTALDNIQDMVKITKPGEKNVSPKHRSVNNDKQDRKYRFRRFKPAYMDVMKDLVEGKLDEKRFVWLDKAPEQKRSGRRGGRHGRKKKEQSPANFLFIVGGLTWSEVRCCYKVCKDSNANLVVGSDCVITPKDFVRQLTGLDRTEFNKKAGLPKPSDWELRLEKELKSDPDDDVEQQTELAETNLGGGEQHTQQGDCCTIA